MAVETTQAPPGRYQSPSLPRVVVNQAETDSRGPYPILFRRRLAKNPNYRELAYTDDFFAKVALDTAADLPQTAPSLSLADMRSLIVFHLFDVFPIADIAERFDIKPTLVQKQFQHLNTVDYYWYQTFHSMYEERVTNRLDPYWQETPWFHHLLAAARKDKGYQASVEEIAQALPLSYFPLGTTEEERLALITAALPPRETLKRIEEGFCFPMTFAEYVAYVRENHPKRLAGIFELTDPDIKERLDKGIAILQTAPGILSYDERLSLLIGDLRMHQPDSWPYGFAATSSRHQTRAMYELHPWMQQYQKIWKEQGKISAKDYWQQPTRRYRL